MGFSTGSVVVPATSDTIETVCRVSAFRSEDLPTLRRPKIPMWSRSPLGVCFMRRPPRVRSAPRGRERAEPPRGTIYGIPPRRAVQSDRSGAARNRLHPRARAVRR